ncbi:MAG: hypothetical protein FWG94_03905 [Oscillospiraceae bacterium]|nr:hypothetical protein [Oscillospiraceae bacterium]
MRITNTTIARNYTSNLNRNLSLLNDGNYRVASGRKFNMMAENTADGVRAMTLRRSLARLDGYLDNAITTRNTFAGAEGQLMKISDLTKDISDRFIVGLSGTSGKDERNIIATELEKLRDQILSCANGQYSDRYLFGGTNTKTQPFTVKDVEMIIEPGDPRYDDAFSALPDGHTYVDGVDNIPFVETGVLHYNGVRVDQIDKEGEHAYLFRDAAYVDLGLGFQMKPAPDSQNVASNSAFKNTLVGLDFLGSGDDNIYNVINEMVAFLRGGGGDPERGGALLDKFRASADNIGVQITQIGADAAYLDFTVSRLEKQNDTMIEQQGHLEFMDPYQAIMDFKMQEYVYNAALQMGSRLLQPSIFNFIR